MPAEVDLHALLAGMAPALRDGTYVFCTLRSPDELPPGIALATFAEDEGVSAVVLQADAERAGLRGEGPFRLITLRVRSALHAVGFTAAVSRALAESGIAANVVAAHHHDHLFVPAGRAADALRVLCGLAGEVSELRGESVGIEVGLRGET